MDLGIFINPEKHLDGNGVGLAKKAYPKTIIYGKCMPQQYVDLELQMCICAAMLGISGLGAFHKSGINAPGLNEIVALEARFSSGFP